MFVAFHVTDSLPPAPIYFMVNFGVFASTNEKFSNEPHTDFVSCRMWHNCMCIVSRLSIGSVIVILIVTMIAT